MKRLRALAVALVVGVACAHVTTSGAAGPASVDTRDAAGRAATLASLGKRVVVVDICAAWSDACLVNARALDEACAVICPEGAAVVTLLLDEAGAPALESYQSVVGTSRPVLSPGPQTLAGKSALGPVGAAIPRLVIFAPDGRIVDDEVGGILSSHGIINRARELLR